MLIIFVIENNENIWNEKHRMEHDIKSCMDREEIKHNAVLS